MGGGEKIPSGMAPRPYSICFPVFPIAMENFITPTLRPAPGWMVDFPEVRL
jgi:hypothetical protein